ncbi:MAG: efflux RND transporter periplasmic adaptor subunit [Patescibacteria group bacterium]|nr:efflux RND transporter periplasmic adaptor subunit [Patescibacteria group bacterium]
MIKFSKGFLNFVKKRWIWSLIILAVIIFAGWLIFSNPKPPAQYTQVQQGEVDSVVSVTGTVKPAQNIDLAFENGGRLASLNVAVGDKVSEGEVLASLDNGGVAAQLAQAKANVKSQQAILDSLIKGSRQEDINIAQLELQQAQQNLASYYDQAINVLNDAYAKANDAVRNQASPLFTNADTNNPQLTFLVSNAQTQINIINERILSGNDLNAWDSSIQSIQANPNNGDIDAALNQSLNYISDIRSFLSTALDAVNNSINLSSTNITAYQTAIATGQTNLNTAATSINSQIQTITSQKLTVAQDQNQYDLTVSSSTPEEIQNQEGALAAAQANVLYYQSQLDKTILTAPFSGTITKVVPNVGDIITAGDPEISLIGAGNFEIETYIAESDIAKIKIGELAYVTLDAYGPDVVFAAKIVSRDLSSTDQEGVATYKTTLQFVNKDPRILPGLTANVDIQVSKKENVLFVPSRDIIDENGQKFVQLLIDENKGTIKNTPVTIGLVGSDGRTEIISGLKLGDKISGD